MSTRGLQPFLDTKQLYILHMYEKHINQIQTIFYQQKKEEEENQTPLRLFYQQTKEEKKSNPL